MKRAFKNLKIFRFHETAIFFGKALPGDNGFEVCVNCLAAFFCAQFIFPTLEFEFFLFLLLLLLFHIQHRRVLRLQIVDQR